MRVLYYLYEVLLRTANDHTHGSYCCCGLITFLILELNCASSENGSSHINKCVLAEGINNTLKYLS
jgi:hypothetical protein